MSRPDLRAVLMKPKKPDPRDILKRKRVSLMRSAVIFVRGWPEGNRADRLREASELTGIPINLIDVEERKKQ